MKIVVVRLASKSVGRPDVHNWMC